ncbi:juvenile hormone esterase-like [Danaus plexippus]|uniref:Carboxylic ester hydrolase n=1 Tax=Danaus plexippus plexippus TaxID=278856 RepID=A0A212EHN6_DANPL|nr:juvenile hormone esterase-like [Danaus plexippus]OWR41013.1 antennal esterase CXE9 [Danaus plexippus plexippus]
MDGLHEDEKCILMIKDGPICGYIERNEEGTYYKFKKIPYAKPPLGNLRFTPPSPATPWTDLLDCTQEAPLPLSLNEEKGKYGSEDCLYMEVNSPNITPNKPMPVMFWIGSCNYAYYIDQLYDSTSIVNESVVFVRCGFRLGPMGFLSINEFSAPGNIGLKDIVMALKWTQTNISVFGGDPNNVTIFGSSTGGATVHYMMISPMAVGLFHKAIMQSSTALNKFSLNKNPTQAAIDLAEKLGITTANKFDMVDELKKVPARDIMEAYKKISDKSISNDDGKLFDVLFRPCVEKEFEGMPTFLSKTPSQILKSGTFNKVPIIIGCNNIEASVIQNIKTNFYEDFEKFNEDVSLLVPKSIAFNEKLTKTIGEQLLNFYFNGNGVLNEHTRTQYLQLLSDFYFLYYLYDTVRLQYKYAPECPIYYYILNYAGEWDVPKELNFLNSIGHCGEVSFLFRIIMPNKQFCRGSRDSITTRNRVVRLWTNFAKYGNPTPDENDALLQITWDPVENEEKLNYLSIGSELTKGRNPYYERMKFWDKLHEQHALLKTILYFIDKGVQI